MNIAFYNGINGVKTSSFGIDVYADNIANIGTTGFISKTPEFSTLFSSSINDYVNDYTANQIGLGTQAQASALNVYTQGVLTPTDRAFDLAIEGTGWFGVQSIGGETYYTKVGAFSIDVDGYLVDESGNYLTGTLGNNMTTTTLSLNKLEEFGTYYDTSNANEGYLAEAYSISVLGDIAIGDVTNQERIYLPDLLYLPPEPTTYVNYQANLNPKIITETNVITADDIENLTLDTSLYPTASLSGSLANYSNLDLKAGDSVTLTLLDASANSIQITANLDENLAFSSTSIDLSELDNSGIYIADEIAIVGEVANVEHFTTEIISPTGEKDIIDMTFTKQVPQQSTQTIWDAEIKVLSYVEDYEVLMYDPTVTYDETVYNVDEDNNRVTKIYDPNLYYVDTSINKVYEIVDSQSGTAIFGGGGELIENNIPTLSNGGVSLDLNIGEPYEIQAIQDGTYTYDSTDGILTISGTTTAVQAGDSITIEVTDINSKTIVLNAKVKEDGTWSTNYENTINGINTLDISEELTMNTYNIVNSGFDGIISHVDLDKAKYSESDGYIEGFISEYGMDSNGNVIAEFDNGRTSAIAKVAIYNFINEQGLVNVTSTMFAASANSGDPLFYVSDDGYSFRGTDLLSNYLESSNVQFSTALTELIIMQKAFDASAKCITTGDELIQNAINMKR